MKNLYSPSMLKSYLSCKYTIFNEVNEKKLKLKKIELSKNDKLRLEKGNIHEKNYLKELKKKYKKVIDLKNSDLTNEEKVPKTIQAMKEGWEVIHGGYLKRGKWRGEFDFLIINKDLKSKFGDYSYEVIDTKNSNKPKPDHIIQLGMYTYMLEETQGVLPKRFKIVLKNMVEEDVQVNQVNEFFKTHRENYELFVEKFIEKTKPEKCSHCQICSWKEECEKIWIEEDNLNQIGGLTKIHLKKLLELKIDTASKLSKQDPKKNIKGFKPEISYKLITQARLQKEYEKTQVPIYEPNPINLIGVKGFNLLPEPSACDLYFDIESVEDHIYPGGLEYLFGIYYVENDKGKFKALWAHNKDEEKQNVIKFFEFTKAHFEKYPSSKIYHYGSYETTALEKLTSLHKTKDVEYDHYMNLNKFVNLLNVNTQGIFISENSYSLKNIEKFYNFKREGDVQKGDVSQEYYSEWVETQDQKYLDEIESYNKQDCISTIELHRWLLKIKPEETSWFTSKKEEMELRDREIKMIEYQNKVENSKIKNKRIKQLLSDIIGFYVRENKPSWTHFFKRRGKSDEELVEDPECVGNMKLNSEPTPEKKSLIYSYKFENQDFKLRKNKKSVIANNHDIEQKDFAGTILDIDYKTNEILLKRGTGSGILPETLSIGPEKPRLNEKLILNTYNYIDSVLDNENNFPVNQIIKTYNSPTLSANDSVTGKTSGSQGSVYEIINKQSLLTTGSSTPEIIGAQGFRGNLSTILQKIADNDYYQRFSYSLKSRIPYENWNSVVSDTAHITGYRKFGDLNVESVGIGQTLNVTSDSSSIINVVLTSETKVDTIANYDLVIEEDIDDSDGEYSEFIKFNTKKLSDFILSQENRVLPVDDISGLFDTDNSRFVTVQLDEVDASESIVLKYFFFIGATQSFFGDFVKPQVLDAFITRDNSTINISSYAHYYDFFSSSGTVLLPLGEVSAEISPTNNDLIVINFIPRNIFNSYAIRAIKETANTTPGITTTNFGYVSNIEKTGIYTATSSPSIDTFYSIPLSECQGGAVFVGLSSTPRRVQSAIEMSFNKDSSGNVNYSVFAEQKYRDLGQFTIDVSGGNINFNFTPQSGIGVTVLTNFNLITNTFVSPNQLSRELSVIKSGEVVATTSSQVAISTVSSLYAASKYVLEATKTVGVTTYSALVQINSIHFEDYSNNTVYGIVGNFPENELNFETIFNPIPSHKMSALKIFKFTITRLHVQDQAIFYLPARLSKPKQFSEVSLKADEIT